jgi:hypothetical protein
MAVGPGGIALTWDGSTWRTQSPPAGAGFAAVWCTASTSCVAVSGESTAQAWTSGTWQSLAPVVPPGTSSYLNSIWCGGVPASDCIAVGDYATAVHADLNLAEQWSGGTWALLRTPSPADTTEGLSGISCPSASFCMAVGAYLGSGDTQQTLAEIWKGRSWTVVATPSPGLQVSYLSGVSCTGTNNCVAVGAFDSVFGHRETLAEQWNGSSWTVLNTLNPGLNNQLSGISCPAPAYCVAVGTSSMPSDVSTLAEQWNGSSWQVLPTPDPGSTANVHLFNVLSAVSCASTRRCVAVGGDDQGGPDTYVVAPLAIAWNGHGWLALRTRTPQGGGELDSVWCTSGSQCAAAGALVSPLGAASRPLAEEWDGGAWLVRQPAPLPPGQTGQFSGIACPGPAFCVAVGDRETSGGSVLDVAQAWRAPSWRPLTISGPSPLFSDLFAVACPLTSYCVAVGETATQRTAAARWTGSRWLVLSPVSP